VSQPQRSERSDRGGRPRQYDDDTERQLLVDAASRVLGRSEDGSISVADVLAEAGLTTRAFYRHFDSKDALSETLLLRDVEAIAQSLARAVTATTSPSDAVDTWIGQFVDVIFDVRRARRASRITQVGDDLDRGLSARLMQEMRGLVCAPLVEILRQGAASGALCSPTPEADAFSIYELVLQFRHAAVVVGTSPSRDEACAHVRRFAWPALGLA
jgi:AcrR family transcriptional regulator